MFSNLDIGFLFSFAVMESNMVREYAEGWIVALSYVLFLVHNQNRFQKH